MRPCLVVIAKPSVSVVRLQSFLGKHPSKCHYKQSDKVCVCVWGVGGNLISSLHRYTYRITYLLVPLI